jgi:hypothetical protein
MHGPKAASRGAGWPQSPLYRLLACCRLGFGLLVWCGLAVAGPFYCGGSISGPFRIHDPPSGDGVTLSPGPSGSPVCPNAFNAQEADVASSVRRWAGADDVVVVRRRWMGGAHAPEGPAHAYDYLHGGRASSFYSRDHSRLPPVAVSKSSSGPGRTSGRGRQAHTIGTIGGRGRGPRVGRCLPCLAWTSGGGALPRVRSGWFSPVRRHPAGKGSAAFRSIAGVPDSRAGLPESSSVSYCCVYSSAGGGCHFGARRR